MNAMFAAFQSAAPSLAAQFNPGQSNQERLVNRTKSGKSLTLVELSKVWNMQGLYTTEKRKRYKEQLAKMTEGLTRMTGDVRSVSISMSHLNKFLKVELDFEWLESVAVIGSDRCYIPVDSMGEVLAMMWDFESFAHNNESAGNNVHLHLHEVA